MCRSLMLLMTCGLGLLPVLAQSASSSLAWQTEADIRFLASDELAGRKPGTLGHQVAACYLAAQYAALGLRTPPGQDTYFQVVPFELREPAARASIAFKNTSIEQGKQWLQLRGSAIDQSLPAVFLGYAWRDDQEGIDSPI